VPDSDHTPRLARIQLHPIKSLDPLEVREARIGPNGGLEHDRAWALYAQDGKWVNGKRTAAMHLIRAEYAPDLSRVTLSVPGDRRRIPAMSFAFPQDTEDAGFWFSTYFEHPVIVRYSADGFPDDTLANGPTIVSTGSLQAVCEWFPGIGVAEARLRFRTTLEVDGVPAFWEDQLFGPDANYAVRFKIGGVNFEGSNPCARCPVPPRDPRTGADLTGFQKHFTESRRAQLPQWAPVERFDHYYRMATNTRVASTEAGKTLRVGDTLIFG
jgi:uncharacterized protein YcbX